MRFALLTHIAFFVSLSLSGTLPAYGNPVFPVEVQPERPIPGQSLVLSYARPELLGHKVFIHYGFNGWHLSPVEFARKERDGIFFSHREMQWDSHTRSFRIDMVAPVTTRALHFAFCWDRCESGQWDSNAGADYGWPVTFPYIGPLLSLSDVMSAESSIVIKFIGHRPEEGWLEYWTGGQVYRVASPIGTDHRFVLRNLPVATKVFYRVGAGRLTSAIYLFKTAKPASSQASASFIAFGDAQDTGIDDNFRNTVNEILTNHSDVDFLISTGDLAAGDSPADWWTFFDRSRDLLAAKILMAAPGNHDKGKDLTTFARFFRQYGGDDLMQSFSYQKLRFLAFNTESPLELAAPAGRQYLWGKTALTALGQTQRHDTWTFAFWHRPVLNLGVRHNEDQILTRAVAQLFEGTVDWALSGHEHLYQRFGPVVFRQNAISRMRTYGHCGDCGVGYAALPPTGQPPGNQISGPQAPENAVLRHLLEFPRLLGTDTTVPSKLGFMRFDIKDNRLQLRTYGFDTHEGYKVVDQVVYEK